MEANDTDTTSPATTETEEEISSPWIEVVRRSLRRRTPPPYKPAPQSPLPPALRHRPSTRQPRQPPLPTDDFKIGIQPRNGLQLSRADPISLTASIAREIGLPTSPAPFQLRVGAEQNVMWSAHLPQQLRERSTASRRFWSSATDTKYQSTRSLRTTPAMASYTTSHKNIEKSTSSRSLPLLATRCSQLVDSETPKPSSLHFEASEYRTTSMPIKPSSDATPIAARSPFAPSTIKRATERTFAPRLPPRPSASHAAPPSTSFSTSAHRGVGFVKAHTQPHLKTAPNGTCPPCTRPRKLQTSSHLTSPAGHTPTLLARGATGDLIVRAQDRGETTVTDHNTGVQQPGAFKHQGTPAHPATQSRYDASDAAQATQGPTLDKLLSQHGHREQRTTPGRLSQGELGRDSILQS
ncbi:hypothetical protein HPB48_011152 [Haemaphysalis longicornis]|uniref:Uncharacterized protein n=1 Tax=Haemaphysalis longicornis TaxID=44386 RepID=A0A9J6FRD7_HAELO|nr:hypothetical protein HPB48_011152 [Haemaphysalis longicornis]